MTVFRTVRGMRDFLPEELVKRRFVEEKVRECFQLYGYDEIETPIIESFELIAARIGDEIRHRMYAFKDHGGGRVAMRPEMTASVARVVASKLRSEAKPLRLGYIANCFRYDNPQRGRYREFWQAGFELFGSDRVEADAEIVVIFHDLMRRLGFRDFILKVGHIGILKGLLTAQGIQEKDQNVVISLLDKRRIKKALTFLEELDVSKDCRAVISKLVTLRGTDWAGIIVKGKELLGNNVRALMALSNLEAVMRLAEEGGVTSTLHVDLGFARGLEYYTGLIFEVFVPSLRIALGGGGRYDGLVELFGGEPTPAVGCAPGIDRIVLAMQHEELLVDRISSSSAICVVPVGEEQVSRALRVAAVLRQNGIPVQTEVLGRSLSAALSHADRKEAPFALIIGSKEAEKGTVTVRNMRTQTQREIPTLHVLDELLKDLPHSSSN